MNINKVLQFVFYPLFLASTVGLLLAIIITYHLPAMALWVVLAITATIVCAAVSNENTTNNQKEDQK